MPLVASMTPATAAPVSALYAFGDSLSDVGNAYTATAGTVPAAPYAAGRFGNGPIWIDDIAAALGLAPLRPSLLGGTGYAVGGAISGNSVAAVSGLGDLPYQLAAFRAAVAAPDPHALYTLSIGGNDLQVALGKPGVDSATLLGQVVNNVSTFLLGLHAAGAGHVIVELVPDLGLSPNLRGTPAQAVASVAAATLDMGLRASLAVLGPASGLRIGIVDGYALTDEAVARPDLFGFTDVTDPCWTGAFTGYAGGGKLCAADAATQNTYLYWDATHPTARAQAVVAERALETLPAPAGFGLFAVGVVALGLLRQSAASGSRAVDGRRHRSIPPSAA